MVRVEGARFWEIWVPHTIELVAVVLGILLAAMIWYIHESVDHASEVLVRGQASELLDGFHRALSRSERSGRRQALEDLLSEQREQGLRYVAVLGPDGLPAAQAGEAAGPIDRTVLTRVPPMDPLPLGNRVRVHSVGPPGPPPERRGGPPQPRPRWEDSVPGRPPRHPPPPPGGGPPPIVIEFEPLKALAVRAQVRRAVWGGVVTIPLFVLGAFVLAFLVRQRERLTRHIEQGRRMAALGEMSAVIAHEIRNPLASLKGHAQLLAESLEADARKGKAQRVVDEAIRIQNLVSDLLDFARTGTVDRAPSNPAALLREAAEEVDPDRITIHTNEAPPIWPLDVLHMKQALVNVLRNAVQATPDGSGVDASVFSEQGCLVFEVRDRGAGIPRGEEEKIFEPFHTRKTRGTGLGLALAQRIVSQHGGTIVARNDPEAGAAFRISIPHT